MWDSIRGASVIKAKSQPGVIKVTFCRPFSIYRSVGFVIQLFFVLGFIVRIGTFFHLMLVGLPILLP